uniref:Calcineurin-like phosphoesterase domain-containing protein n=1 Tax=Corethron hystrix TaxID=216773 RepID=A0A7S1C1K6_9STRA|mmetsp:Transcript_8697/g.19105  ORF Transcript_8697/g.19105 Transcript_8697/m.19105 type:complete len:1546 (+) Transcript_8697:471-5108(+)
MLSEKKDNIDEDDDSVQKNGENKSCEDMSLSSISSYKPPRRRHVEKNDSNTEDKSSQFFPTEENATSGGNDGINSVEREKSNLLVTATIDERLTIAERFSGDIVNLGTKTMNISHQENDCTSTMKTWERPPKPFFSADDNCDNISLPRNKKGNSGDGDSSLSSPCITVIEENMNVEKTSTSSLKTMHAQKSDYCDNDNDDDRIYCDHEDSYSRSTNALTMPTTLNFLTEEGFPPPTSSSVSICYQDVDANFNLQEQNFLTNLPSSHQYHRCAIKKTMTVTEAETVTAIATTPAITTATVTAICSSSDKKDTVIRNEGDNIDDNDSSLPSLSITTSNRDMHVEEDTLTTFLETIDVHRSDDGDYDNDDNRIYVNKDSHNCSLDTLMMTTTSNLLTKEDSLSSASTVSIYCQDVDANLNLLEQNLPANLPLFHQYHLGVEEKTTTMRASVAAMDSNSGEQDTAILSLSGTPFQEKMYNKNITEDGTYHSESGDSRCCGNTAAAAPKITEVLDRLKNKEFLQTCSVVHDGKGDSDNIMCSGNIVTGQDSQQIGNKDVEKSGCCLPMTAGLMQKNESKKSLLSCKIGTTVIDSNMSKEMEEQALKIKNELHNFSTKTVSLSKLKHEEDMNADDKVITKKDEESTLPMIMDDKHISPSALHVVLSDIVDDGNTGCGDNIQTGQDSRKMFDKSDKELDVFSSELIMPSLMKNNDPEKGLISFETDISNKCISSSTCSVVYDGKIDSADIICNDGQDSSKSTASIERDASELKHISCTTDATERDNDELKELKAPISKIKHDLPSFSIEATSLLKLEHGENMMNDDVFTTCEEEHFPTTISTLDEKCISRPTCSVLHDGKVNGDSIICHANILTSQDISKTADTDGDESDCFLSTLMVTQLIEKNDQEKGLLYCKTAMTEEGNYSLENLERSDLTIKNKFKMFGGCRCGTICTFVMATLMIVCIFVACWFRQKESFKINDQAISSANANGTLQQNSTKDNETEWYPSAIPPSTTKPPFLKPPNTISSDVTSFGVDNNDVSINKIQQSSLKIAFVGDTGMGDPLYKGYGNVTMAMIEDLGADLVVYVGDFDYWGRCWEKYIIHTPFTATPKDGISRTFKEGEPLMRLQWREGAEYNSWGDPTSYGWELGILPPWYSDNYSGNDNIDMLLNADGSEIFHRIVVSDDSWWYKFVPHLSNVTGWCDDILDGEDAGPWDGPWEWMKFIRGYSFDFLAASGNHEVVTYSDGSGGNPEIWAAHQNYMYQLYKERILDTRRGTCRGYHDDTDGGTVEEYGERYSCLYGDHHFLFLGWYEGSDDSNTQEAQNNRNISVAFIEKEFSRTDSRAMNIRWRYCVHHRTSQKLTSGGLKNEGNMNLSNILNACMRYGALLISGHHHVYQRTKLLDNVGNTEGENPNVANDQSLLIEGRTMSIGVGNGGYQGPCSGKYAGRNWQKICIGGKKERGAVIATFNKEEPWKAEFTYYNSFSGREEDKFKLESKLPGWKNGIGHRLLGQREKSQEKWASQHVGTLESQDWYEPYPYGTRRRPFNPQLEFQ